MIIAQISDTHILAPDSSDPQFSVRANAVENVVRDINALAERPDVVIHSGDLAQNRSAQEYQFLCTMLSALKMPYFVVPGNRDDSVLMAEIFPHVQLHQGDMPFIHYCIDDFTVRVIALDSRGLASMKGNFTEIRLCALRTTLDQDRKKPTVLTMHHPPFDVTGAIEPFQYETRAAVVALSDLLSTYSNVIRIFSGHSHRARLSVLGSVSASTMPSTAPDLRQDTYPDRRASSAVYQVHKWDGMRDFISATRMVD